MTDRLMTLLDMIHATLLSGRFRDLPVLVADLECEFSKAGELSLERANKVRQKARRNQDCLVAALSGVRQAQHRVAEISRAARGLATYDSQGLVAMLPPHRNGGRRA